MVPKKSASKRHTVRQMHKVKRKVAEASRKARKQARNSPATASSKLAKFKRDPGVPNLFPLKDKVLAEAAARKLARLENRNATATTAITTKTTAKTTPTTADADAVAVASAASDSDSAFIRSARVTTGAEGQRGYYRELNKIFERADVVIEVLDARDPVGTRAPHIEQMLLEGGTVCRRSAPPRLVLVLNKTDLVPKPVVAQWLTLLRREFPVVAFKANTQAQRSNLGRGATSVELASDKQLAASETLGAEDLMNVLKNYARVGNGAPGSSANAKTSITVGVIGYPNVGKSSLINSLKRSRVCNVGAAPGITRCVQEVVLDKHVRLLDCPGIVFAPLREDMSRSEAADMMLRNCVRLSDLEDPVAPVEAILARVSQSTLMVRYGVPVFRNSNEFLAHVARSTGKLRRGGVPDVEAAARVVLQDWNSGKIPFFVAPPQHAPQGESNCELVEHRERLFDPLRDCIVEENGGGGAVAMEE